MFLLEIKETGDVEKDRMAQAMLELLLSEATRVREATVTLTEISTCSTCGTLYDPRWTAGDFHAHEERL